MHNHASGQKEASILAGICYRFASDQALMKKGSTVNAALWEWVESYQPFGSIPKRSSSLRPSVLSQLAKLIPASEAATSNCAFSSGVMRTGKTGALPSDECLLSRFAIDMYIPTGLVFYLVGIYLNTVNAEKETPPKGITSTRRGLTSNVMETNAMAKPQCNQTHPKFQYRFLAISRSDRNAKPCRMSVEAHTEREARQVLAPHFILSLAARLPLQEVIHV